MTATSWLKLTREEEVLMATETNYVHVFACVFYRRTRVMCHCWDEFLDLLHKFSHLRPKPSSAVVGHAGSDGTRYRFQIYRVHRRDAVIKTSCSLSSICQDQNLDVQTHCLHTSFTSILLEKSLKQHFMSRYSRCHWSVWAKEFGETNRDGPDQPWTTETNMLPQHLPPTDTPLATYCPTSYSFGAGHST